MILLSLLLELCAISRAAAQEPLGQQLGTNLDSGHSATDFLSRLRVQSGYIRFPRSVDFVTTRFSIDYALRPNLSFRLQVPFLWSDPNDPSVSSAVGLGDIKTRALFRVWQSPHFSAVVGTELTFPTATDPLLGTQKFQVSPLAALIFQYRNFLFVPVYQQVISYAGNVDRNEINIIRFRPVLLAAWPRGWWTTLEPGLWWDLENAFLTEDTATLGFEVGKRITERLAFSGKPSVRLNGSEEFAWSLDFSLSYVWE